MFYASAALRQQGRETNFAAEKLADLIEYGIINGMKDAEKIEEAFNAQCDFIKKTQDDLAKLIDLLNVVHQSVRLEQQLSKLAKPQ
jgi:hypothetical protein